MVVVDGLCYFLDFGNDIYHYLTKFLLVPCKGVDMVAQLLTPGCHPVFKAGDFLVLSCELCISQRMQLSNHAVSLYNVGFHGCEIRSIIHHVVLGH
jgi:hypothetical protein